jgi:hypothetical protein
MDLDHGLKIIGRGPRPRSSGAMPECSKTPSSWWRRGCKKPRGKLMDMHEQVTTSKAIELRDKVNLAKEKKRVNARKEEDSKKIVF